MKEIHDSLNKTYKDVLRDTLPEGSMYGPDMFIKMRNDISIKLRHGTTTKPLPVHYQKEADKLIDKLLNDGIIEPIPAGEISAWISPALFILKEGGRPVFTS